MVLDGRGERSSYLSGHVRDGTLEVLAEARLPNSLGLVYEELTAHLGYRRSSDEYKVMALASYGRPRHLEAFRRLVRVEDDRFVTEAVPWADFAPPGAGDGSLDPAHADLASTVQARLEEALVQLATDLHARTGERALVLAGGVALNCVANSALHQQTPFSELWVQPAAGDAGTALGAALAVAEELGDRTQPMATAALGRSWSDDAIRGWLRDAGVAWTEPDDIAEAVASELAADRHRRLVPGPHRVRASSARPPQLARPSRARRQPRAAQRRQGPRAVPPGRPHGAGRAGCGPVRRRPAP
jgi:carbamoyltransferase